MQSFRCAFKFKVILICRQCTTLQMLKRLYKDNRFRPLSVGHHQVTICTGLDSLRARYCPFAVPLKTIIYLLHRYCHVVGLLGGGRERERKVFLKSQVNIK
jgi:hypothetical protein